MIVLLKLILITTILVLGLRVAVSHDMILERLGNWAEKKVGEGYKICELFICPWCMPSVWSLFAYVFAFGLGVLPLEFNWQLVIRWPLIVMGSSFLSGFIWTVYLTLNSIKEKNENISE
jgi:hypothetical protein